MLQNLKSHSASFIFNEPLDSNHILFNEIKYEFVTLNMLDLYFKLGNKFQKTNDLANEIRKMIVMRYRLTLDDTQKHD